MRTALLLLFSLFLIPAASAQLVVTEIMYNPGSSEASPVDVEWIEIANTTASPVDLSAYRIGDSADNAYADMTGILPAFGIAVVIGTTTANFEGAWGDVDGPGSVIVVEIPTANWPGYSNSPSGTNESVAIQRISDDALIDEVFFDDSGDWPGDDGVGSIYLTTTNAAIIATGTVDNDVGTNWAISAAGMGGAFASVASPGDDPFSAGDIGSPGTVNSSSVLPVELTAFTATANGNVADLRWETASETNNTGFEVQMDGGSGFSFVDFVQGAGTTLEATSYAFRVADLAAGSYRFRLKQVDLDGAFEFSPVVELSIGSSQAFALTAGPNPFRQSASISLQVATAQDVTVAVYDLLGRSVARLFEGAMDADQSRTFSVDGSDLAPGLYVVRATGERFTTTRQIVRLR